MKPVAILLCCSVMCGCASGAQDRQNALATRAIQDSLRDVACRKQNLHAGTPEYAACMNPETVASQSEQ